MRSDIIKKGVLILIIGIIIGGFGYADLMFWLTDLSIEVDYSIVGFGGLIFLIGLIYSIYGAIAKPNKSSPTFISKPIQPTIQQTSQPIRTSKTSKFCTKCGNPLSIEDMFCSDCGAKRKES
jgi:hypothetical protein